MFALTHQPIPAVIEEVVVYVGGDVPVCDYKTTGSRQLGEEVASQGRRPQRGGSWPTTGSSRWARPPDKALHIAELVERTPRSCGARGPGRDRAAARQDQREHGRGVSIASGYLSSRQEPTAPRAKKSGEIRVES